ncbi:hypothetical protein HAX54_036582, partial [Datura stramonium]|nr:hypothetical protein [Datura stramonium]
MAHGGSYETTALYNTSSKSGYNNGPIFNKSNNNLCCKFYTKFGSAQNMSQSTPENSSKAQASSQGNQVSQPFFFTKDQHYKIIQVLNGAQVIDMTYST